MLKNFLKTGARMLLRQKGYTVVNITGLAVGVAVCLLILLWVQDELRYDRFHENADRIYRTIWDGKFGDNQWSIPLGPVPVGETIRSQFTEVESATQLIRQGRTIRHRGEYIIENDFLFVDEHFFDVFTVDFISGRPETALQNPDAVVLTEETGRRYFGEDDPIDKILELADGSILQVTGVVRQFPSHSHIRFDFLANITSLPIYRQRIDDWGSATAFTYFVLHDGTGGVEFQFTLNRYVHADIYPEDLFETGNYFGFTVQSFTDIHLGRKYEYDFPVSGNRTYVYLFSVVGIFILLLACVNYVNLTTARSMKRAREVGIRKTVGSGRFQLVYQFLFETLILVSAAVIIAAGLADLSMPLFNDITGKDLTVFELGYGITAGMFVVFIIVISLLAGFYPAALLSTYRPITMLRQGTDEIAGGFKLRNALVVFQFCVSIILIIGTYVVHTQLQYLQSKQLGFDKEYVLIIEGARTLGDRGQIFIDEITALPGVKGAAQSLYLPGKDYDSMPFEPEQPANYEISSLTYDLIDHNFIDVIGLEILSGRNFDPDRTADSTAFIINEAAAAALGWDEPVGRELSTFGGFVRGQVIGVVRDFHFRSLHHPVEPIVFPHIRFPPRYISVRMEPGNIEDGIVSVRSVWDDFVPTRPFVYSFLDEDLDMLYRSEQQSASLFNIFSGLSVIIACLGLFGIATYTAERRTKEIGIRKVLGASVSGIVGLLSKDLLKLVIFSNIIAWPVAYIAMNKWLENFAYRFEPGLTLFITASLITIVIAVLTVSYQAIRAALTNPVEALRYE
jgi:putative ABC transport system permease protein